MNRIVSQEEWIAERKRLMVEEKEFTRRRDALAEKRRALPWVRIEKDYEFDSPEGRVGFADLFRGRSQLWVQSVMQGPGQPLQCVGCALGIDHIEGLLPHLENHDVSYVAVARATMPELTALRERMGWRVPFYSSYGSDFNYDFHATTDEAVRPVEYNYRDKATLERLGQSYHVQGEQPGVSVFLREDDAVFHTYSTYGRGLDLLENTNNYLDLTVFGRGEGWGGMPDLHGLGRHWLRHHDRYGSGE
jgi:predicted dithiol-disulfide oxidoreductase (DUF899 family)